MPEAIDSAWELAGCEPGARPGPEQLDGADWIPARVPGTAAAALRDAGLWQAGEERDLDDSDWWFRARFDADAAGGGEEVLLRLDGIATVADVYLNGERVLESRSMFARHVLDVGERLRGANELAIHCRALGPLLEERRKPRARWRSRLPKAGNLRFFRTMLIGRAPGFAPGPAAVGPWRPVTLERRSSSLVVDDIRVRARLDGDEGVVTASASVRLGVGPEGSAVAADIRIELELSGPSGTHRVRMSFDGRVTSGELRVPGAERWWPHTHGDPVLHEVRLSVGSGTKERVLDAGRVGFRSIAAGPAAGHDVLSDGLDLHVNGVRIFARGAVWTPPDAVGLAPSSSELRRALEQVRDAGMNMVRVPGIGAYESETFHDLCDELGILVWQDFMFANLDYPIADGEFRALVETEARQALEAVAGRPSLAVLCGNSEVEQQAAMLGLEPEIGRGELFGELLPQAAHEAGADAIYVPSAPCGGDLPFRPAAGVANYYGVGAYMRPLADARLSRVRFAAECLAFANVPGAGMVAEVAGSPAAAAGGDAAWKARVPRDVGAGWDFEDVRDHYLALLYEIDPASLRGEDPERYLELSRALSGEVMAAVFGEWRRAGSPSGGGLVLWLRDLFPGPGWGVIDSRGGPKVAYHHLRRALSPVAVWTTDEGLDGIAVHVANDRAEPLRARLRVALYRDRELMVDEVTEAFGLGPHGTAERNVETMLGRFADVGWAYRFGPPAQDLVVASLEGEDGSGLCSQAFRLPAGRLEAPRPASELGLEAEATELPGGAVRVAVRSRRFADGVRVHAPGFAADDDAFGVEPGGAREVLLAPITADAHPAPMSLSALNLDGLLEITPPAKGL